MAEYIEMLEMGTARRRTYYTYLHGKYQNQDNDKVYVSSMEHLAPSYLTP